MEEPEEPEPRRRSSQPLFNLPNLFPKLPSLFNLPKLFPEPPPLFNLPKLFPGPRPLFNVAELFPKPAPLFNAALFAPTVVIDPGIFRVQFVMPPLPKAIVPDVATYFRALDVDTVESLVEEAASPRGRKQTTTDRVTGLLALADGLTPLMAQCLVATIVWLFSFGMLANAAHRDPDFAEHINNVYGVSAQNSAPPPAIFAAFLMRMWEAEQRRRRRADG